MCSDLEASDSPSFPEQGEKQLPCLTDLPLADDPALGLVGLGRSGYDDLSADHDRYLIEFEREGSLRDNHLSQRRKSDD